MRLLKPLFKKRVKPMTYQEAEKLKVELTLDVDGIPYCSSYIGRRTFYNCDNDKLILIRRILEFQLEMTDIILKNRK